MADRYRTKKGVSTLSRSSLLRFLPVGIVELRVEDDHLQVIECAPLYGLASSDTGFLKGCVLNKSWRTAQEERTSMPRKALPSLLKQPRRVAESGLQVSLKSGET